MLILMVQQPYTMQERDSMTKAEFALDKLKREVRLGDFVVFNPPKCKGINIGKVIKIGPSGRVVTARHFNPLTNKSRGDFRVTTGFMKVTDDVMNYIDANPEIFL